MVTVAADQASKAAVRAYLPPSHSIPLVPGVLDLNYVRNSGAAFGLLEGQRLFFILTALAVLAGIAFVWFRYKPDAWYVVPALGLVVGGALGNLADRVLVGRVTDFLYLHFWPVFNLADSAIVVGVTVLVFWLLFRHDDEDEEEPVPPGESGEA